MSFVKLENLNDFIQPSQACIKPVEKKKPGVVAKVTDVNLSDCLACSGCITSAESVLVQQQNHDELFRIINHTKMLKENREIVVSLSLQSISSLANKYSMDVQETAERIASFFISLGCHKVYDINLARHLALVESYREFNERRADKCKPIISSICPGWICYAEKTNGDLIIPHLSKVRSPQQIMGSILKRAVKLSKKCELYHVTLMPCFDKKLEASRQDFKNELDDSQDVDCVLTPVELEDILLSEGVTLLDFDRRNLDIPFVSDCAFDKPLTNHFGSVSGGYAENILLAYANKVLGLNHGFKLEEMIKYSALKNKDFIELDLQIPPSIDGDRGEIEIPKFAIVNGFRNIQTIVQRLKRGALKYDYIEIMACPSGCINGGAQSRPKDGENPTQTIEAATELYRKVPVVEHSIDHDNSIDGLYEKFEFDNSHYRHNLLYTDFHPVPKMQNLTVNW